MLHKNNLAANINAMVDKDNCRLDGSLLSHQKPANFVGGSRLSKRFLETFTPLTVDDFNCADEFPKKPPTSFLLPQDWNLYLRVCCHLRQIQTQYGCSEVEAYDRFSAKCNGKRRGTCIVRLVSAFNNLYGEYAALCDALTSIKLEPKIRKTQTCTDRRGIQSARKSGLQPRKPPRSDMATPRNCGDGNLYQISDRGSGCPSAEVSVTQTVESSSTRLPSENSFVFSSAYTQTPAFEDSSFMSNSEQKTKKTFFLCHAVKPSSSLIGPNAVGVYDCIQRQPPDSSIWVSQISKKQPKVEHVVAWMSTDGNSLNNSKVEPIRLPIGLELILPRMQRQIETIMSTCRFVYDPLEVIAELRTMNYDTNACIAYFDRSKPLRDIIQEFLPTRTIRPEMFHRSSIEAVECSLKPENALENPKPFFISEEEFDAVLLSQRQRLANIRRLILDATRRIQRLHTFASGLSTVFTQIIQTNTFRRSESGDTEGANDANCILHTQLKKLTVENEGLKETLRQEVERRMSVFNMMQEYLGNIRVFCRCRLIAQTRQCLEATSFDTVTLNNGVSQEEYKFDRVFGAEVKQSELFEELRPLVHSFMDGFNVCFLTYGGEASGKTYTLLGGSDGLPESRGIVQRSLQAVLCENEARKKDWISTVSIAVIEVYNDVYTDLLSGDGGLHPRVDLGAEKMMEGLQTEVINTSEDVEAILQICKSRRRAGKTALNPSSSRSHLVVLARLYSHCVVHEKRISAVLALCDLAGFEDVIKADTLNNQTLAKEAGFINRSLTALNRLFSMLRTQDATTISYRDSKLTYLLKPFFTNSGKCILIVTVRTDRANMASTQGTLRFGRDSRAVSLGRARRQISIEGFTFERKPN